MFIILVNNCPRFAFSRVVHNQSFHHSVCACFITSCDKKRRGFWSFLGPASWGACCGFLGFHWLYSSDPLKLWCFTGYTQAIRWCSGVSLAILKRSAGALVVHWLYSSDPLVVWCFTGYTQAIHWCSGVSLALFKRFIIVYNFNEQLTVQGLHFQGWYTIKASIIVFALVSSRCGNVYMMHVHSTSAHI